MTLLIISSLLFLVVLPLGALYWLGRPSSCRVIWALKAVGVSGAVVTIYFIGGWQIVSYYGRSALLVLLAVALLVGAWRMRKAPLWRPPETGTWIEMGVAVLVLLVSSGSLFNVYQARQVPGDPIDLAFPLRNGAYYVASGGSTALVNPHMTVGSQNLEKWRGQLWALDIVELNSFGNRARAFYPTDLNHFEIFGAPVYAPCEGRIERVEDAFPDLPPPARDTVQKAGNYVLVRCEPDAYVLLAHLKQGSTEGTPGDTVSVNTRLGAVGNSGNSSEPHLHLNAQREPGTRTVLDAAPVPMTFEGQFPIRNEVFEDRTRAKE